MARMTSRMERVRREAARVAQHEHLRLGTPMDRQVDIFGIIERAGIWLMFQPMSRVFGAYKRYGDTTGIILNSNHPTSLQRYTAAHEYGHHALGHEGSLDAEENVEGFGRRLDEREVATQTFAADFLMPLQLVNYTLRSMGLPIKSPQLSPFEVYQLSLRLGASYAATISQLVALKKINATAAEVLRKHRPIVIKEESGRLKPDEPRADVWIVEEAESGREVTPRVHDEVHVLLPEMPSTGYVWGVESPVTDTLSEGTGCTLTLIRDLFEALPPQNTPPMNASTYGEAGIHRLVFKVVRPGTCMLRVAKRRPWQTGVPAASVVEVRVHAFARPTGEADRGLSEHQKPLLAAA